MLKNGSTNGKVMFISRYALLQRCEVLFFIKSRYTIYNSAA
jgi:hypothetical protein